MNICITGGLGFIGSNAASYFLRKKDTTVTVFDNLSRKGTDKNLHWLQSLGGKLHMVVGDVRRVRDIAKLSAPTPSFDLILHLAAQVAVTTSVINPREDFEVNALGTLNVLEWIRHKERKAKFIYASSNKVYGSMDDIDVVEEKTRYTYKNLFYGISEDRGLDFHSPYGCSKGCADQYVHDYGRIYGLDTVVMRQSCIYGPRQFGIEDQGWVAWFIIAQALGLPFSIYGNGKQVRDLLYIDDCIRAYDMAFKAGEKTRGHIYNIGGGRENTISVWHEFGPILEKLFKEPIKPTFHNWRQGDQKIFVADIRKASKEFGWIPKVGINVGITKLYNWIRENNKLFM